MCNYLEAVTSWFIKNVHRSNLASSSSSNGKNELKSNWVILAQIGFRSLLKRSKIFSKGQMFQNWIVLTFFTAINMSNIANRTASFESNIKSFNLGRIFFKYAWDLGQVWIMCVRPFTTESLTLGLDISFAKSLIMVIMNCCKSVVSKITQNRDRIEQTPWTATTRTSGTSSRSKLWKDLICISCPDARTSNSSFGFSTGKASVNICVALTLTSLFATLRYRHSKGSQSLCTMVWTLRLFLAIWKWLNTVNKGSNNFDLGFASMQLKMKSKSDLPKLRKWNKLHWYLLVHEILNAFFLNDFSQRSRIPSFEVSLTNINGVLFRTSWIKVWKYIHYHFA